MAKITEEIEREKEMQAGDHSLVINLLSNNMFLWWCLLHICLGMIYVYRTVPGLEMSAFLVFTGAY